MKPKAELVQRCRAWLQARGLRAVMADDPDQADSVIVYFDTAEGAEQFHHAFGDAMQLGAAADDTKDE